MMKTTGKRAIRHIALAAVLGAMLAGCTLTGRELPSNDAPGADAMKKSPCVCLEVPYEAPGFTWRGSA